MTLYDCSPSYMEQVIEEHESLHLDAIDHGPPPPSPTKIVMSKSVAQQVDYASSWRGTPTAWGKFAAVFKGFAAPESSWYID